MIMNAAAADVINILAMLVSSYMVHRNEILDRKMKRFFLFAALGGGPGLWLGMRWFHHKTKHPLFWFAAVGSTLLYGGLFLFLLLRFGGLL